jgi:hypothetical protein
MRIATHKIQHGIDKKSGHSHTVSRIFADTTGRFWMNLKCVKGDCEGEREIEVLPAQVEAWKQAGVTVDIIEPPTYLPQIQAFANYANQLGNQLKFNQKAFQQFFDSMPRITIDYSNFFKKE